MAQWQPAWTAEVKIEGGGGYPLGLNAFHDGLDGFLIPSLTMAANRLRLITYYVWAIGDITKKEEVKTSSDFVTAFTRRENALAIGLFIKNKSNSDIYTIGPRKLSHVVKDGTNMYDLDFNLMESNPLGNFGLYYKGTAQNIGLIENDETEIIKPTIGTGEMLYEMAEKTFNKAEYFQKYKGQKKVPVDILVQWATVCDMENIRRPECQAERDLFKRLLFRLDGTPSDFRRDTFMIFLEAALQACAAKGKFNDALIRNINYYRTFYNKSKHVIDFQVPKYLEDVHFYWKIYEGHVYFRYWLTCLFCQYLDYLKECSNGGTPEDFIANIDEQLFNKTCQSFGINKVDLSSSKMQIILKQLEPLPLIDSINSEESIFCDKKLTSRAGVLAKTVLTMGLLYTRFAPLSMDKRYIYIRMKRGSDLSQSSMYTDFPLINNMSVRDFLMKILKKYVIVQHVEVMIDKHDLRRAWFTEEDGKHYFKTDATKEDKPDKFWTIRNFLFDMGLLIEHDEITGLTNAGETLVEQLKREYYT